MTHRAAHAPIASTIRGTLHDAFAQNEHIMQLVGRQERRVALAELVRTVRDHADMGY